MASNEQRDLETVKNGIRLMTEDLLKMDRAGRGIAKNFTELALQVRNQQKGLVEYVGSSLRLPAVLTEASRSIITPMDQLNEELKNFQDKLNSGKALATQYRKEKADQLAAGLAAGSAGLKLAQAGIKSGQAEIRIFQEKLRVAREQADQYKKAQAAQLAAGKAVSASAADQLRAQIKANQSDMQSFQDRLKAVRAQVAQHRKDQAAELAAGQAVGASAADRLKTQVQSNQEHGKAVDLTKKRIELKWHLSKLTGERLAAEYLIIRGFIDAVRRSGEMNKTLIEANSEYKARAALTRQVWEVMAKTGNEQQDMLAAAKALVGVGFDLQKGFKSTLEVMVQMEEGLGVSYENSAQLARVFELNLRTPVREVADKIAAIANQSSLMADEATRFATEIGKALRLLGPGAIQGSSAKVVGYLTMMAGRMKDVGGDAQEVARMIGEMTKGTAQGFMLRGLSGVNQPGAVGTDAGARAAMQGIDRVIKSMVQSRPGTMAYVAELEAASQVLGTTTETVVLWRDMMLKANEPLNEQQKLENRWREQVTESNKSISRIRESIIALLQTTFLPVLQTMQPVLAGLASFVSTIAANKTTATVTLALVVAAGARAAYTLGRVAIALTQVSLASYAAAKSTYLKDVLHLDAFAKAGGDKAGGKALGALGTKLGAAMPTFASWSAKLGAAMPTVAGLAARLGTFLPKLIGLASPVGWVAAAGLTGWAVGRYIRGAIEKAWPDNWITNLASRTSELSAKAMTKPTLAGVGDRAFQGTKTWYQVAAEIRQAIYAGREQDVESIFRENVHLVKGLTSERGAAKMLEVWQSASAEARERIGLASVTSAESETLKHDAKIIDLTRKGVEAQGSSKKLLEVINETRKAEADRAARSQLLRDLQEQTSWHMLSAPGSASKSNIIPSMRR